MKVKKRCSLFLKNTILRAFIIINQTVRIWTPWTNLPYVLPKYSVQCNFRQLYRYYSYLFDLVNISVEVSLYLYSISFQPRRIYWYDQTSFNVSSIRIVHNTSLIFSLYAMFKILSELNVVRCDYKYQRLNWTPYVSFTSTFKYIRSNNPLFRFRLLIQVALLQFWGLC